MNREEYRNEYLRSEHWRAVRLGALERAGNRCQVCNGSKRLDVHHRTYDRIGREEPSDLTVLCRTCHDTFHSVSSKPAKQKQHRENWSTMSNDERAVLTARVVELLKRNSGGLTAKKIGSGLGVRAQIVGSCLVAMRRDGKASKHPRGNRWQVPHATEGMENWVAHFESRPFRSMRKVGAK